MRVKTCKDNSKAVAARATRNYFVKYKNNWINKTSKNKIPVS